MAAFYARLMEQLAALDLPVKIYAKPNEVAEPIPFAEDDDPPRVRPGVREPLLAHPRAGGAGLRGRSAPASSESAARCTSSGAPPTSRSRGSPGEPRPSIRAGSRTCRTRVTREAYSHEVSSCGFWAGGGAIAYPAFYSYAYPEPPGFAAAPVKPEAAFYSNDLREFILPYDAVRESGDPDATLLEFLQATYEAAANLARWDRAALERTFARR